MRFKEIWRSPTQDYLLSLSGCNYRNTLRARILFESDRLPSGRSAVASVGRLLSGPCSAAYRSRRRFSRLKTQTPLQRRRQSVSVRRVTAAGTAKARAGRGLTAHCHRQNVALSVASSPKNNKKTYKTFEI